MMRTAFHTMIVAAALSGAAAPSQAQENWLEVKSAHFTVVSNAGEGTARSVARQFEQFRGAIEAGWPWAQVRLDRPIVILAVRGESNMRRLLPAYWERAGSVKPASLLATAPDRHYIAIRTDTQAESTGTMNPYLTAYWSYSMLVLNAAFEGDLPLWFRNGLAEVLSNTVVRETEIRFGLPIPWHIQSLRESRLLLRELLTLEASDAYYTDGATRARFDALAWSVVHYMLFGRPEDRSGNVNTLARLLDEGKSSIEAVEKAFGSLDALQDGYLRYKEQSIFRYARMNIEETSMAKTFPSRRINAIESAALRGALHVATGRPAEAQALIGEVRKTAPESALSYEVEALLHDREGARDQAKAAFGRAAELKSSNRHVYYRLAALTWGTDPDAAQIGEIEDLLNRAIAADDSYAPAYTLLADAMVRTSRADAAVTAATKAMQLAPKDPGPRLALARALWQGGRRDLARSHALGAEQLARTDAQRAAVRELREFFERATGN